MAISATHYELLKRLQPLLPRGGTLLEIGEANWYGDIEPDFPCPQSTDLFAIARAMYAHLFAPRRVISIDMNGTEKALRYDLNKPLPPLGAFDLIINHGTAEHVFNIAQVFTSIHSACAIGGLMIHEAPFTGWIDHGFYCLQPTLFYDLAAVNGYEIVSVDIEEIKSGLILPVESRDRVAQLAAQRLPDNAMLFVVLRKLAAGPFQVPAQGYYAKSLSEAGRKAWEELR